MKNTFLQRTVSNYSIFFIAFIFYLFTLAPTVVQGDSAGFCVQIKKHILSFGQPDAHLLFNLFGILFSYLPFELAYSINMESAFFGAVTVLLIYHFTLLIGQPAGTAYCAACSCMVSHAFWLHSVIAEVYTLHSLFVVALVMIAYSTIPKYKKAVLLFIVFVSGMLNHLILFTIIPAVILYYAYQATPSLRKKIVVSSLISVLACVILAVSFFIYFPACARHILRKTLLYNTSFIIYLLPPQNIISFMRELVFYFLYLVYQFPAGGIVFIPVGIIALWKSNRSATILILLTIASNALFFIKTTHWQSFGGTKFTFYICDYVLISIFMGTGTIKCLLLSARRFFNNHDIPLAIKSAGLVMSGVIVISTILFYSLMPKACDFFSINLVKARTMKFRDNNRFFLNPSKRNYTAARSLGEHILTRIKPGGVIFADHTIERVLTYLNVTDERNHDISIYNIVESDTLLYRIQKLKCRENKTDFYLADTMSYYNTYGFEKYITLKDEDYVFLAVPGDSLCAGFSD